MNISQEQKNELKISSVLTNVFLWIYYKIFY